MINRIKIPGCLRIDLPSNGTTMQNSLGKFDFKPIQNTTIADAWQISCDLWPINNWLTSKMTTLKKVCAKLKELKFLITPH